MATTEILTKWLCPCYYTMATVTVCHHRWAKPKTELLQGCHYKISRCPKIVITTSRDQEKNSHGFLLMLFFFYFPLKVAGGNPLPLPLNASSDCWQDRNINVKIWDYLQMLQVTSSHLHSHQLYPHMHPLPHFCHPPDCYRVIVVFQSYSWFNFYLSLFSGMLMYNYEW